MSLKIVIVIFISVIATICNGFALKPSNSIQRLNSKVVLNMVYIPNGLTKEQWEAIQNKEAEELNKKKMGALGTTKFKSRSFEAWQKAGGKHLFPVDPRTTSYEERPYMQRKDGDWEGKDLKKRGLQGFGQGAASQRIGVDDVYDGLEKEGKLNSVSIFGGVNLPWTNKDTEKMNNKRPPTFNPEGKQGQRAVAAKELTPQERERLQRSLVKPIISKKSEPAPVPASEPPKKKLFGLF